MWIGIWDPDRDDNALLQACAASLERAGARVQRTTRDDGLAIVIVDHYPALCPPGEELAVEQSRNAPDRGGLVEIFLPMPWFDEHPELEPAAAWAGFLGAMELLLADVQPLLLVCPVELGVQDLPDVEPVDVNRNFFSVGWVNPARLDPKRREAFDRVLRDGPRTEMAGGWWWSADPDRDPGRRGAEDHGALSRAIYTAWTGQPAPELEPEIEVEEPLNEPQLWLWAADREDDRLLAEVRAWARQEGDRAGEVELGDQGAPGWFPVIVSLGFETDPATWLPPLRRAVATVKPSWAALPASRWLVPGVDPEIPSTGALNNVWVNHDWIGDRLGRLLGVLDGAHREELAGGTLLVTEPELLPDGSFADWCRDPEARWDRVVEAAAVLAEAARASRQPP